MALQTERRTVRPTGLLKAQPTEPQTGQHLELQMARLKERQTVPLTELLKG